MPDYKPLDGGELTPEEIAEAAELAERVKQTPAKTAKTEYDTLKHTELGNAERLIARHGESLRYSPALGWLVYTPDAGRWVPDVSGEIIRRMAETICALYPVAKAMQSDPDEKTQGVGKALENWLGRSESAGRIKASIELAQSLQGVYIDTCDLDANPHLLNVQNGTLDLRTGALRPHNRADLITRICPVAYNKEASAPTWQAALQKWQPLAEVQNYLRRAAGYSLTGSIKEHTAFLLLGNGRNGKSTFVDTLASILGKATKGGYAAIIPMSVILDARKNGGVTPELVDLVGARFVVGSEIEEGRRINEAFVKDLTGGGEIKVNPKNKATFDLAPLCKLWLYGNHAPAIRGTDEGIWSRLPRINFDVFIPVEERDHDLMGKLFAEREGILAWAVQGARDWYENRLSPPTAVLAASDSYRKEQDPFEGFFGQVCRVDAARTKDGAQGKAWFTSTADIRAALKNLVGENEEKRITPQMLGERLKNAGAETKVGSRDNRAVRGWAGVILVSTEENPGDLGDLGAETVQNPTENPTHYTVYTDSYIASREGDVRLQDIDTSVNSVVCKKEEEEEKGGSVGDGEGLPSEQKANDAAYLADMEASGIGDPFAEDAEDTEPATPPAPASAGRVVWGAETSPGVLAPGLPVSWGAHFKPSFGNGSTQRAALEALVLDLENESPEVRRAAAEPVRLERARLNRDGEPVDAAAWLKEWLSSVLHCTGGGGQSA